MERRCWARTAGASNWRHNWSLDMSLCAPEASRTQADALRHAVSLYLNSTFERIRYYHARYDVALARLRTATGRAICARPRSICSQRAGTCTPKRVTEPQYCGDDRLYAVHASQLRAFATTLHAGSAGCWVVAGHGCWDAMRDAAGGRNRIDLCIDASKHDRIR